MVDSLKFSILDELVTCGNCQRTLVVVKFFTNSVSCICTTLQLTRADTEKAGPEQGGSKEKQAKKKSQSPLRFIDFYLIANYYFSQTIMLSS